MMVFYGIALFDFDFKIYPKGETSLLNHKRFRQSKSNSSSKICQNFGKGW